MFMLYTYTVLYVNYTLMKLFLEVKKIMLPKFKKQ